MRHVDVVVIGGSLAGSACVRELMRRGVDAVAFERDRFPREKVCGGFLSPGAIDLLDELAVLDAVRAAGAIPVHSSTIRMHRREIGVELPRPGLGISRRALDGVMADHPGVQHGAVREVRQADAGFTVKLDGETISAKVVVDAAGKLSRFTKRRAVPQFGVQFYEAGTRGDVLDFWFFEDGYGGAVTVEGERSNACFLISKDALTKRSAVGALYEHAFFPHEWEIRAVNVTGPLAYEKSSSDFLSIGDASGMIDPFCGEGMRHALDTGMNAARVISAGLARGESYTSMRARYEHDSATRWRQKRRLGTVIRHMLQHPRLSSLGFRLRPEYWFRKLWD